MYDDDDAIEHLDREQRVFDEKLERVGGVFVEPEHTEVDCNAEPNACAPDDYPDDPYSIDNRPGTPDDVGYSLGLQSRDANDLSVVDEGRVHEHGRRAPDTERDLEAGTLDEKDLWDRQKPLITEDEDDGIKVPLGMNEEDAERVMSAMGDDSGDATPEGIEGNSATGEPTSVPDHGGFPEQDD